jgi:hypothetical protein
LTLRHYLKKGHEAGGFASFFATIGQAHRKQGEDIYVSRAIGFPLLGGREWRHSLAAVVENYSYYKGSGLRNTAEEGADDGS